mmetsp:Transcript_61714/g.155826  ORF Transcript_61714/g.155826 Transcript_61714/m.155826 type:complete len:601 (-) Transcript_61714:8-1810(-)
MATTSDLEQSQLLTGALNKAPATDAQQMPLDVVRSRQRSPTTALLAAGLSGAALLLAGVALAATSSGRHGGGLRSAEEPVAASMPGLIEEAAVTPKCAVGRSNCKDSQCCEGSGLQCYEQDGNYAQCRVSCLAGVPDPQHWDSKPWSCRELGGRTAGEPACGKPGKNCSESQCCADPGLQCFAKHAFWATCKADCVAGGPDITDIDSTPWSCQKLGVRTPGAADWVKEECSSGWQNCIETKCCKLPGEQCHKQNDFFGECKPVDSLNLNSCNNTPGWSCEKLGLQTPALPVKGGTISPWAAQTCGRIDEECTESKCCLGMDVQCYEKAPGWALCMQSCVSGPHADDGNDTWSCTPLGPRSYGLPIQGPPSLFCFLVLRTVGYEVDLLTAQKAKGLGIFDCDDHMMLTADATIFIGDEQTVEFPGAPIVKSVDGTAGNTFLFVNAWKVIVRGHKWREHSFTAKLDPDAVFFPERLRWHVSAHQGEKVFVINCYRSDGDTTYGALEVFSLSAIQEWAVRAKECRTPGDYGEDKYMTQCMDQLGVARFRDEGVLGDKLCLTFTGCGAPGPAAFHPFKDLPAWEQCWHEANSTADAQVLPQVEG